MLFNSLLFYYGMVLAALFYLLYCVNPNGTGILTKIRNFLLNDSLNRLSRFCDKIFGPNFSKRATAVKDYIFFTNNSIVMIFYLVIGPGSYCLYIHQIMIKYYGFYNPIHLITGNAVGAWAFYMYYKAVVTDPGTITMDNHKDYVEKYKDYVDGFIFERKKLCTTCKTLK